LDISIVLFFLRLRPCFRDLLLHLHNQLLQLLLALLPRVDVHVSRVLLAVGPDVRVAALEQVVAQLADAGDGRILSG